MTADNWTTIAVAAMTLLGVIFTAIWNNKQSKKRSEDQKKYTKEQTDLTLYRVGELEKKQDKYNHLQERVAKMEAHDSGVDAKIEDMRSDLKSIKAKLFDN